MKAKIFMLFCFIVIFVNPLGAQNQSQDKKVAILEPIVNEKEITYGARLLLKQSLTSSITAAPGYAAYTRSLAEVLGEQKFQRTGLVNDADIVEIGRITGVSYVLRVEMAKIDENNVTLSAEMIDVKTAKVEQSAVEVSGLDEDAMVKKCRDLTRKLFGQEVLYGRANGENSMSAYGTRISGEDYMETALGVNMQMVWVEGGSFLMGCTAEQGSDCWDDEKPVHRVTLDGYYIGKFEVTQGQWEKVMGTSIYQQRSKTAEYKLYGAGSDRPMYYVSWEEATAFCEELSRRTGKNYRLLTEAQWEYAARGGNRNGGSKYSGSSYVDMVAWNRGNSSNGTHPVGMKRDNLLGIHDMSGNVWEWCRDWYEADYSSVASQNPQGSSSGFYRVRRGGGWFSDDRSCRVSARSYGTLDDRNSNVGFRVVCEP